MQQRKKPGKPKTTPVKRAEMTVGERIKARRLELGLSQEVVALLSGYKSRSSINKIELSRSLPLKKITRVAAALEISPAELAGFGAPEKTKIDGFHDVTGKLLEDKDFYNVVNALAKLPARDQKIVAGLIKDLSRRKQTN